MPRKFDFRQFWRMGSGTTLEALLPFLVAIGWDHELVVPKPNVRNRDEAHDRQTTVRTCFLVELDGVAWLITAGHVITTIEQTTRGSRRLVAARLYDYGGGKRGLHPVPFPLDLAPRFHVDREELGLDLGAIQVHGHWARLLYAGGATPFSSSTWAKEGEQFDTFALVGFPSEHLHIHRSRLARRTTLGIRMGIPLLLLAVIKRPPKVMKKKYARFYAKIRRRTFRCDGKTIRVEDIDGMSGGPVVGLRINRRTVTFRLVGVQSSWLKTSRVIAASPIADFVHVIQERLKAAYPNAFPKEYRTVKRAKPSP